MGPGRPLSWASALLTPAKSVLPLLQALSCSTWLTPGQLMSYLLSLINRRATGGSDMPPGWTPYPSAPHTEVPASLLVPLE